MKEISCPFCGIPIPPQEIVAGWCESCGKSIPPFILSEAEARRKSELRSQRDSTVGLTHIDKENETSARPEKTPTHSPDGVLLADHCVDRMDETGTAERTIILPYAISNIVFIQRLFMVAAVFFGCLLRSMALADVQALLLDRIAALMLVTAGVWAIGSWALSGNRLAIIMTYLLYLPWVVSVPINVGWVIVIMVQDSDSKGSLPLGFAVPFLGISTLMSLCIFLNLWEKGLWEFVALNGRCPQCRTWRFGKVKQPCTIKCGDCGASLTFVRISQ